MRIKKLMLSGISVVTNNKDEFSEENGKIPQLWDDYFKNDEYTKTFNKARDAYMYGVYSDYTSDVNGDYKVTIGIEVTKPKNAIVIENQKYLVFSNKGELPDAVVETWETIWEYFEKNDEHKRKYSVDFEKYLSDEEIEIYISVL